MGVRSAGVDLMRFSDDHLTVHMHCQSGIVMSNQQKLSQVEERRQALKAAISALGNLRAGQLTPRFRKCGKPSCHCAHPGDPGHGPSWSLTRKVAGKTVTTIIPAGPAVAETQMQLDEYRRFRELSHDFVAVSEALCDAALEHPLAASDEAKKKGFKKTSGRRSRAKSSR
jgi:hypothetical protein